MERLHDILVQRARGGGGDESEYRGLREYVLETEDLAPLAPGWLRRTRTLEAWWATIQPMFKSYAERQGYVTAEFEPLFEFIESLPRDGEPAAPVPRTGPKPAEPRRTAAEVQRSNEELGSFFSVLRFGAQSPSAAEPQAGVTMPPLPKTPKDVRVFIVHGHDTNRREAVARFVEKLGFEAVILADQPNQGRTIIEKFEAHAAVDYAVVVMTPDDMGGAKGGRSQPRARQNVVLEHGFFIGILGRNKVAALVVGDIEKPSDLSGVLYITWDDAGAWRTRLAREMQAAGLPVDMNLA